MSRDRGATWGPPHPIAPSGTEQVDTQIVVDPVDGRTLYAAWLQNRKSDTVIARSSDLGKSWSVVVADHTNAGTDKPILAVRARTSTSRTTTARPCSSRRRTTPARPSPPPS